MPREHTTDTDWFSDWMRDWTRWWLSTSGYSSTTVLWRAMAAQNTWGTFGSRIPAGVVPPSGVARIQRAFNGLLGTDIGEGVLALKIFWLSGGGTKVGNQAVMQQFDCSERKAYELVKMGSSAMKGYLRALNEKQ